MRRGLLLTLCLALPGCWRFKDCSEWPFMSAGEYWAMVRNPGGHGVLESRDEYVCLYIQPEEEREFYRVDRKVLTRAVQEESYRLVVQRNIARLKKELARGRIGSMRTLEDYTGLYFDDPEQWIHWWEENHERLRLAPDGRHVIVGP